MAAKTPQSKRKRKSRAHPGTPALGELRLLNKVAVVTGGSRGIGQAIARVLAAEGCSVVITGREKSSLARSATRISRKVRGRGKVVPLVCDVRDAESVASLFAKVKQRFHKLDILVNNAGITQPVASVQETSLEVWYDV